MRAAALACLLCLFPAPACGERVDPTRPLARQVRWWLARHQKLQQRVQQGEADLVFVGDSITQGWEREGQPVWQQYYLARRAMNLGLGGDETGHVLWRLARSELQRIRPRVVVLLLGVNNAYRRDHSASSIAAGVAAVVWTLRRRLPQSRILLLGIFPAGAGPNPMREKIRAVNRHLARLADGKRVHFLDIGHLFLTADGRITPEVMFDYLHLTEKGYCIWAEAMEPRLRVLLGKGGTSESRP